MPKHFTKQQIGTIYRWFPSLEELSINDIVNKAAHNNDVEMVRRALGLDASTSTLTSALMKAKEGGNEDIIKLVLKIADEQGVETAAELSALSALMGAAKNGHSKAVDELVQ